MTHSRLLRKALRPEEARFAEASVTKEEAISRLTGARVGRIATVRPDGTPHVVPFVFAFHRDGGGGVRLYWIVDDKRKRTSELRRLENIRSQPTVEVVVDRYDDDDWTALWWVRARGRGRLVSSIPERDVALDALASKYAQYASVTSAAHVVAIDVDSVTGWSADDPADR